MPSSTRERGAISIKEREKGKKNFSERGCRNLYKGVGKPRLCTRGERTVGSKRREPENYLTGGRPISFSEIKGLGEFPKSANATGQILARIWGEGKNYYENARTVNSCDWKNPSLLEGEAYGG